ncbi:MAG: DUF5719 family protein [Actinomycetaceae bacterium]|nr:DUF5719 family protein [Actinomycetaceae bacterium]
MKRFIGGLLALALACAGGALAVLGASNPAAPVPVEAVEVPPAPLAVSCGGELERTYDGGVDVADVAESIEERSWVVAFPTSGTAPDVTVSGGRDVPRVGDLGFLSEEAGLAGVVETGTVDPGSLELAGGTVHTAAGGDLRGLATNPCLRASLDQWLVGSRAQVGVSNQLILTNPGPNPSAVEVEALTATGLAPLGTAATTVVDAGETKRISLDGSLQDEQRFALHITADSGGVAASMQQTSLDGYTPNGVTFVTPTVASEELTIPGVKIDDADGSATLRIANPASKPVTVDVSTIDADGKRDLPGGTDVTVEAGSVLDLNLQGLPAGEVSLEISASDEVVAGAEFTATSGEAVDNAWVAARPAASSGSAVFGQVQASLVAVSHEGKATVTAYPVDADGAPMDPVRAEVDGQGVLQLPEGAVAVRYEASTPVSAGLITTVGFDDGTGVDWVPLGSSNIEEASRRVSIG